MIKVLELFAGIGACSKALTNLGIEHEIVDAVEIDKYAVKSFNAVHGTNFGPQDITKWDKDLEVDLIMHGSPCQDFSTAGKQAGGDKGSGTRSSLMYETLRIVEKLKPKYVIWENVKNLISKKHRHNFDAYQDAMEELGYNNHYQVLNAKHYGVPQNRERVFTVSIRNDLEDNFEFPTKQELTVKLKDILESKVDEKYYLSDKALSCFMSDGTGNYPRRERFLSNINRENQNVGNAVTTRAGSRPTDNFVKVATDLQRKVCNQALEKGLVTPTDVIEYTYSNARLKEMEEGHIKKQNAMDNQIMSTLKTSPQQLGVCVEQEPFIIASRGRYVDEPQVLSPKRKNMQRLEPRTDGISNTLTSVQKDNYVATPYRIRKLTPKECWRLMGFDDSDFEKAEKVNSNSQLYKQAGNSIVVDVLMAILSNLLKGEKNGE